jgi:hypothetical protein
LKKLQTFLSSKAKRSTGGGQFGSQNKDVDVYQPDCYSYAEGVEDEEFDDVMLHDLGVECSVQDSERDALRKVNGALCQPIHHSGLRFRAQLEHRAKICQVCEYEERGEVQMTVNISLTHSARLCIWTHLPVIEAGLVMVDDGAPVTDFSWACPNPDWSCWNKFHNFYVEKGIWSSRAGLVNEEKQCLDFCCWHTPSLLNRTTNEAMGIEDHRGETSSIG